MYMCNCVGFFCVCLSHTHELHPVLIKAGCSFYIITEFASCLQRILLLSLFAAPQSSSITFTTLLFLPIALLPSVIYYTPSFSSPFPLMHLYFLLLFTPHALPVLPKKCILNFCLTDQSNTSRLPPKKLFAFSLLLYLFPFFFSLFDFLFYIVSLFNISHQHSAFSLSSSCFMPPWGDHVAG